MSDAFRGTMGDYYVQIAALTPSDGQVAAPPPMPPVEMSETFFFPVIQSCLILIGFSFAALLSYSLQARKRFASVASIMVIGFIASAIPLGMQLVEQEQSVESRASATYQPKNILVTQVEPSSFTISWATDIPDAGVVRLRETAEIKPPLVMLEEPGVTLAHSIKAENLKPNTTYHFDILAGGVWYDDGGKPISFTTME